MNTKSSEAYAIPIVEYDLDNGMHVILSKTERVPLIVTNLWYHVGSKDEEPNRTGFAHLFEHMMFQGSRNVGKTEHFKYIQRVGGSLNATTSVDRTNYFQTLPSGELELALWLESDRMLTLDVTQENFQNQRDVVKEERRQRYENRPYGTVWENMASKVFPTSGYHWTTIGSMAHLDDSTIDDVRAFHVEYYKPNNCSLSVIGNFNIEDAKRLIDRYFGGIPKGTPIDRRPQHVEPLTKQIRLTLEDNAKLAAVYMACQSSQVYDRDEYVVDLMAHILDTGRSSRLYHELVYKREVARDVEAFNYANEKAGAFVMSAKVQPKSNVDEVESAMWGEIEKLQHSGVTTEELEKVKNRVEMLIVSSLPDLGRRADRLQRAWTFKRDTAQANRDLDVYRSVTAEEIQGAANKYLQREKMVVAHVLPK